MQEPQQAEFIEIPPDTRELRAMHNRKFLWRSALGELIDNAFDAGANCVRLTFESHRLTVADDGHGFKDLLGSIRRGGRFNYSTTELGRYGVGLKDTATWLWGDTSIATLNGGRLRSMSVNWEKICTSGRWIYPAPLEHAREKSGAMGIFSNSGSVICFANHVRPLPDEKQLRESLAFTYFPALTQGRQVVFSFRGKAQPLQAFKVPPLETAIERELIVEGKRVVLLAGTVSAGHENPRPGFNIAHAFRIIDSTEEGCEGYLTSRFFALVRLGDGWQLTTNKESISRGAEPLFRELRAACEPILRRAGDQALTLHSTGLSNEIGETLNDAILHSVKEKRSPGDSRGTHDATGLGGPRITATNVQPGDKSLRSARSGSTRNRGGRVSVEFDETTESRVVGKIQSQGPGAIKVFLFAKHPSIAAMRSRDAARELKLAVAAMAARRFAEIPNDSSGTPFFKFQSDDVEGRFVELLSGYVEAIERSENSPRDRRLSAVK
jgi:hypothetical protein